MRVTHATLHSLAKLFLRAVDDIGLRMLATVFSWQCLNKKIEFGIFSVAVN